MERSYKNILVKMYNGNSTFFVPNDSNDAAIEIHHAADYCWDCYANEKEWAYEIYEEEFACYNEITEEEKEFIIQVLETLANPYF